MLIKNDDESPTTGLDLMETNVRAGIGLLIMLVVKVGRMVYTLN